MMEEVDYEEEEEAKGRDCSWRRWEMEAEVEQTFRHK